MVGTYYEMEILHCNHTGLLFDFDIGRTPVPLAEVCYDLKTKSPVFIHYLSKVHTNVLEEQVRIMELAGE